MTPEQTALLALLDQLAKGQEVLFVVQTAIVEKLSSLLADAARGPNPEERLADLDDLRAKLQMASAVLKHE